jgi:hypothetical protein
MIRRERGGHKREISEIQTIPLTRATPAAGRSTSLLIKYSDQKKTNGEFMLMKVCKI